MATSDRIIVRAAAFATMALIALSSARAGDGESNNAASLRKEAMQHFQNQEWAAAAAAFEKLTKEHPDDGEAWYRLGYTLHAQGKLDEAIVAHERAGEIDGPFRATAIYNLGCAYALQHKSDLAFEALNRAIEAGMYNPGYLKSDPDLESIRSDSRFDALLERMATGAPGPYRELDFWVGEWSVFDPTGQPVGSNSITKQENGFVIAEHWTSATGGSGRSMSFFDPSIGKWRQVWVASSGASTMMVGEFRNGAMYFDGEPVLTNGVKISSRMTLTPNADGTVRQYSERSSDGGKTWNVYFDGKYVRKEQNGAGATE